jgi:iron complex outermembrane receptor protein
MNNFTSILFNSRLGFILLLILLSAGAAQAATITGVVTDGNEPLPGAVITVKGTSLGTTADLDGVYSIEADLPATLVASYVGYESMELLVTEANKNAANFKMSAGIMKDEVIVIGTRASNRTNLDSPVPVDVLNVSEISKSAPQTSINQLLHMTAPSFSSNTQTISDGTDHIDPAALRGLGPDQVLVLINGKRRHTTSLVNTNGTFGRGSVGTDLNAIPASAIDKIEVLRDGAAAQYGSDAIAGVINLRLKENVDELTFNLTTGANFTSEIGPFDGETKSVDGEVFNLGANYGLSLGDNGGLINLSAEMDIRGASNRMLAYDGSIFTALNGVERLAGADGLDVNTLTLAQVQQYGAQVDYFDQSVIDDLNSAGSIDDIGGILGFDVTDQELAARGQQYSDYNMLVGQSAIRGGKLFANLSLPMGENAELYAFGGSSYRRGTSGCFFRLPGQSRTTTSIYPNGTVPRINSNIQDKSIGAGIKGKAGLWDIDISTVTGSNSFLFHITDTHNATLGTASPTDFDAGGHQFRQTTTNMDLSRYFKEVGSLKGINVAYGAEYRLENFKVISGSESSWGNYDVNGNLVTPTTPDSLLTTDLLGNNRPSGAQCFAGFLPSNEVDANRSSVAGYLDLEADITDAFLIGAAVRFEDYSDFGSTVNYKGVARYKVSPTFTLRTGVSTGFRAPSLHQKHYSRTSTIFNLVGGVSIPQEVGIFSNTSRAAKLLGIPELKEETSTNMSFGFTSKFPEANLRLTVDAYQVNIDDRVVLTGQFSPGGNAELQSIFDQAGATAAAFFANAISTESQGVDVVLAHSAKLGNGVLKTDLAGTFTRTTWNQDEGINASDVLEQAGLVGTYFDQTSRLYLEQAVPRMKITLGNSYDIGKVSIYLRNTYFGETTEATGENIFDNDLELLSDSEIGANYLESNPGSSQEAVDTYVNSVNDPYNSAKILTDLSIGYAASKDLTFTVGANNLLDVYPDLVDAAYQSNGRFIYSRRSPQFSFGGRFLFARVAFTM